MINKRLKDALFSDQWSELCMDTLSPFGYVLVSSSIFNVHLCTETGLTVTYIFSSCIILLGGIPANAGSAANGFLQVLPPSLPQRCADTEHSHRTWGLLGTCFAIKSG